MKKIGLITCVFCCHLFGWAQNNIVKGQVNDSLNNPVPLVHVMIYKSNTFVFGAVTDFDGRFTMENLTYGSYALKIEAIGYTDFVKKFTHQDGPLDFGILQLSSTSIELDEVELVGRKKLQERRANSLVINVEQNIASAGGSVLDLLGNTAGVSVNQQNGTLSLNGKGQIAIMVDGKPSRVDGQALISLLKSMPTSDTQKLEVFNNPPAKYEAAGSGGMINIITKSKNSNLQGGTVSLNAGYGRGEKTGGSSSFHYQYGKVGLFGSYSFSSNRSPEEWGLEGEFDAPMSQKTVRTNSFRKPVIISHNYTFGIDYALLKNTEIGGVFSGYSSKWEMVAADMVIRDINTDQIEMLAIETNEVNHWKHSSGNFHIVHSFGELHQLAFNYDHLYYNDDNPSNYKINGQGEANFVDIQKTTPITFNVYSLDYQGKFSKSIRAEVGFKTTSSNFQNNILVNNTVGDVAIPDNDLSNSTQMSEKIKAVYSSLQFHFGEKTSLTTGLRYENTENTLYRGEEANPTNRRYGNLFPSAALTYQINEAHRIKINYGKRINRPTFNHLAPFVIFLGPDALYSGNANLQPAFVNKYSVEWGWLGNYISFEYQNEKDAIAEFQPRLSANGQQYIFKAENLDLRNIVSASLGIPFQITQWWQAENNLTYLYETLETRFDEANFKRSKGNFRATTSQQFSLSENTKLEVSGYYQSPTLFGISTFGARGTFNIGVQHRFGKKHGALKLSFANVFASDNWKIRTNTTQPFISTLETYFPESRIVTLTYTKDFGGNKKRQKYKGNSADEEKRRVQ